ncbi:MAG: gliding motility-associated C-terminal domain-containing protein, partial [Bacteroidales bacterium]|nr:gliding motility-associated C-terminal domain-containing protein [Bacteroidales bacterium]
SPPLELFAENEQISLGDSVKLVAAGGSIYNWTPAESLRSPGSSSTYALPKETTTYIVQSASEFGCISTKEIEVKVVEDYKVKVSNLLTPDDNEKNDYWRIQNIENYPKAKVRVFNRWGEIVFEKVGYQNDWDGRRKNDILPDGVYFYVITFPDTNEIYKGVLSIFRNLRG